MGLEGADMGESVSLPRQIARRPGLRGRATEARRQQASRIGQDLRRRNAQSLEKPRLHPTCRKEKGDPMDFSATEILSFLTEGGHIVRDNARDALVVKAANG